MKITVGHLFPDMLNLYGDSGNIAVLKHRLQSRGIETEVTAYGIEDEIDFSAVDILLIGGGGEREQHLACGRLKQMRDDIVSYAEDGGVILAVCGGYHILGKSYDHNGEKAEGIGVLDIITQNGKERLIGDVVLQSDLVKSTVVGFENHTGKTSIGNLKPFGRVLYGHGNGDDGTEGVVYRHIIGTNLHGPLLPKNPAVADWLIEKAIERRGGELPLAPLNDTAEQEAHNYIVGRFKK
ncbi:MAG: glutamine amidotransferase [Ruminococcaceae bacterium]|nr:glutamine amidotransferase [Oscillospiraceae bacterium]